MSSPETPSQKYVEVPAISNPIPKCFHFWIFAEIALASKTTFATRCKVVLLRFCSLSLRDKATALHFHLQSRTEAVPVLRIVSGQPHPRKRTRQITRQLGPQLQPYSQMKQVRVIPPTIVPSCSPFVGLWVSTNMNFPSLRTCFPHRGAVMIPAGIFLCGGINDGAPLGNLSAKLYIFLR